MTDGPTANEHAALRHRLEARREELLDSVRRELLASDDERYVDLAGRVYDVADAGSADLLVDLQLASIDQHIEELRDIEAALRRLAERSYGICEDCGDQIPLARLEAYPTARRCHRCQEAYEHSHAQKSRPRL